MSIMTKLKIDCRRLTPASIDTLVKLLRPFVKLEIAGGDLIFASGTVTTDIYNQLWWILSHFDVDVD